MKREAAAERAKANTLTAGELIDLILKSRNKRTYTLISQGMRLNDALDIYASKLDRYKLTTVVDNVSLLTMIFIDCLDD